MRPDHDSPLWADYKRYAAAALTGLLANGGGDTSVSRAFDFAEQMIDEQLRHVDGKEGTE